MQLKEVSLSSSEASTLNMSKFVSLFFLCISKYILWSSGYIIGAHQSIAVYIIPATSLPHPISGLASPIFPTVSIISLIELYKSVHALRYFQGVHEDASPSGRFEYLLFYSSSDLNRNFIDWLELQSSSHIKFQEVLI